MRCDAGLSGISADMAYDIPGLVTNHDVHGRILLAVFGAQGIP